MQEPVQLGAFQPQTIYDAPETLFSMLVDGELTRAGAVDVFLNPDRLTLAEREGLKERLQAGTGNTRVGNALVDIATNPWVWMAAIFSPPGAKALSNGGRVFDVAAKYSPFRKGPDAANDRSMLSSLGLLGIDQELRGTPMVESFNQIARERDALGAEFQQQVGGAMEKVLRKLDIPLSGQNGAASLDPDDIRGLSDIQKKQARYIELMLQGRLEGWEHAVEQVIDEGRKGIIKPILAQGSLRRVASEMGIASEMDELVEAYQGAMQTRFIRLYGKDTPENLAQGKFEVDGEKVLSVLQGAKRNVLQDAGASSAFRAQLSDYLGDGLVKKMSGLDPGDVGLDDLMKEVEDVFTRQVNTQGFYFPRRARDAVDLDGRVEPKTTREMESYADVFAGSKSTKAAAQRTAIGPNYHYADLEEVADMVGPDGTLLELGNRISASRDLIRTTPEGRTVMTHRIQPTRSVNRYLRDTDSAYALYVAAPDDLVMDAVKQAEEVTGTGTINSLGEGRQKLSIMDVVGNTHDSMDSVHRKNIITKVVMPMATGTHRVDRLLTVNMVLQTKKSLRGFVDSRFGKLIEESHPLGKSLIEDMRKLGDPSRGFRGDDVYRDATATARGMANFLYVSHLGLNMGSALLNMTQPFLLAVPILASKNPATAMREISTAYKNAFSDLFNYMAARKKQGFRTLDDATKAKTIRENIRDADLLGISPETFHHADELENIRVGGPKGGLTRALEFMMKGFEKSEWFNRIVVRNLTEEAFKTAGRAAEIGTPSFRRTVDQMIASTQFGGSRANSPLAFVTQDTEIGGPFARLLSNPLLRMFMQFTTRSFTAVFETGPKLGGAENRVAAGTALFLRGMATSAMLNAVYREVLEADFQRGLFANASFELVRGEERFNQQNAPVRVPPIVDIPWDAVSGLASGDAQLLGSAVARLLPSGVAAQRLTRLLPKMPDAPLLDFQKTYVDYGQMQEDGRVPVFRADGVLIDYRTVPDIVLGGLGADLGRFSNAGKLDGYLVGQSELMREMRREAITALLAGNIERYQKAKTQFERRFGIPMTISREHLDRRVKLVETPRTERILDMLPIEAREAFTRSITDQNGFGGGAERLGLTEEALASGATSGQRSGNRPQLVDRSDLAQGAAAISDDAERAGEERTFPGFDTF